MNLSRSLFLSCLILPLFLTPARLPAQHCQVSVQDLDFGVYSNFTPAPTEAATRILVRCDGPDTVPVALAIDSGQHSSGFAPRQMRHSYLQDHIGYLLFTDAAMTAIWGDGTRGSATIVSNVPPGVQMEIPIFGRIPSGQDMSVGKFSDRVAIHVDW